MTYCFVPDSGTIYVCLHIPKTKCPSFTKFSVYDRPNCRLGSPLMTMQIQQIRYAFPVFEMKSPSDSDYKPAIGWWPAVCRIKAGTKSAIPDCLVSVL